jgi:hypothetical protein
MRFRKLRIAWSVTNGITCLLLIVCWVVSYHFIIWVGAPINGDTRLESAFGHWMLWEEYGRDMHLGKWFVDYWSTAEDDTLENKLEARLPSGFGTYQLYPTGIGHDAIVVKQWAPVLAFTGLTVLPWFPSRFTLRTLLIATTLVAVGLGLVVYAVRK